MKNSNDTEGLTEAELIQFQTQGYFTVKGVLEEDKYRSLYHKVMERYHSATRPKPSSPYTETALFSSDSEFLSLIDHPRIFSKVVGLMGDNIRLFSSQLLVKPPRLDEKDRRYWHVDGPFNLYPAAHEAVPLLQLKVMIALSDVSEHGRGNLMVVPGSHHAPQIRQFESLPDEQRIKDMPGQVEVLQERGDVTFFHQSLWHTPGNNRSNEPRVNIINAYCYVWAHPFDYDPANLSPTLRGSLNHTQRFLLLGPPGNDSRRFYDKRSCDWFQQDS